MLARGEITRAKIPKKTLFNIIMMYALTGLFIYLVVLVWHSMHSAVAITLVVTSILIYHGKSRKIKGYETVYKLSIISVYE